MQDGRKTKKQLTDELVKLRQRIAELEASESARTQAEKRTEHLNLVLRAIRNVNQLIVREKDRDRLLKGTCKALVETRGYHNAWMALVDESGGLVATAEAGLGDDFLPLLERLERGELTACAQRALSQPGVVVTEDPPSACADCPLAATYGGRIAMTVRLEHEGKVYGLACASIPADFIAHEEERSLFEEVAGDVAFALHAIELEEERKRAEEALRESEERYHLVSEMTSDIAYLRRFEPDGTTVTLWATDAAERIYGYTAEELDAMGRWSSVGHPDDRAIHVTRRAKLLRGEPDTAEFRIINKSGEVRWVSDYLRPLPDPSGRGVRVLGALQDITERKQAEEELRQYSERLEVMVEERTRELREAQDELVRKEKLAVLGQLGGGVAHELRNPLGAIKNSAYFLNMVLEEADPEVKETVDIIDQEVSTCERIINSLLDFARGKPPVLRKVNINEVVQKALSRVSVPESVELVTRLDEALPQVLADPDQLAQVFANIALNAVQAMPKGGQLLVTSTARRGDSQSRPVSRPAWVTVSFADTGVGIPEQNMRKIFEPLFTTKAKGIGLGLPLVKTLIEGHDGAIDVDSEVGKGTTFTVKLPLRGQRS